MPAFNTRPIAAALGAALAAAGAATAFAAPASAATVTTNRACYHEDGSMMISGSGFYAGSNVEIAPVQNVFGGEATTTVGADGTFRVKADVPSADVPGAIARRTTLDVEAFPPLVPGSTLPEITKMVPVYTVTPGVSATKLPHVKGQRARERRFTFADFRPGHKIYGYYLRDWNNGEAKDSVARLAFGRATGPCGVLHTTAPIVPSGKVTKLAKHDLMLGVTFSTRSRYTPGQGIMFPLDNHGTKLFGSGFGKVIDDPTAGPAVARAGHGSAPAL